MMKRMQNEIIQRAGFDVIRDRKPNLRGYKTLALERSGAFPDSIPGK
jgi:hypothetical protein